MYALRDEAAEDAGMELIVYQNPEAKEKGINPFEHGSLHTDLWETEGLKKALNKFEFDAAFGGARRDEEKSGAREHIFSLSGTQSIDGNQNRSDQSCGHYTILSEGSWGEFACFPLVKLD